MQNVNSYFVIAGSSDENYIRHWIQDITYVGYRYIDCFLSKPFMLYVLRSVLF